jgi:hypothetical protein
VAPGESFWSIAEQIVGGRLGRMPTTAEVARYWTALIAANSSRLPIPAQPNLLYTGTLVVLPPSA